jgi:hypothetical protein
VNLHTALGATNLDVLGLSSSAASGTANGTASGLNCVTVLVLGVA